MVKSGIIIIMISAETRICIPVRETVLAGVLAAASIAGLCKASLDYNTTKQEVIDIINTPGSDLSWHFPGGYKGENLSPNLPIPGRISEELRQSQENKTRSGLAFALSLGLLGYSTLVSNIRRKV